MVPPAWEAFFGGTVRRHLNVTLQYQSLPYLTGGVLRAYLLANLLACLLPACLHVRSCLHADLLASLLACFLTACLHVCSCLHACLLANLLACLLHACMFGHVCMQNIVNGTRADPGISCIPSFSNDN